MLHPGGCSFAVVWHVTGCSCAVGELFETASEAQEKYDDLNGGYYATRYYDYEGNIVEQYGSMSDSSWEQLADWRNENACLEGIYPVSHVSDCSLVILPHVIPPSCTPYSS